MLILMANTSIGQWQMILGSSPRSGRKVMNHWMLSYCNRFQNLLKVRTESRWGELVPTKLAENEPKCKKKGKEAKMQAASKMYACLFHTSDVSVIGMPMQVSQSVTSPPYKDQNLKIMKSTREQKYVPLKLPKTIQTGLRASQPNRESGIERD